MSVQSLTYFDRMGHIVHTTPEDTIEDAPTRCWCGCTDIKAVISWLDREGDDQIVPTWYLYHAYRKDKNTRGFIRFNVYNVSKLFEPKHITFEVHNIVEPSEVDVERIAKKVKEALDLIPDKVVVR